MHRRGGARFRRLSIGITLIIGMVHRNHGFDEALMLCRGITWME